MILVCRFIIDVRRFGGKSIHNGSGGDTRGPNITTLPNFRAAIRNLDTAISAGMSDPDFEGSRFRGTGANDEELLEQSLDDVSNEI